MRTSTLRSASLLLVLAAALAAPQKAGAAVYTFLGTYGADWNYVLDGLYANWLNGLAPMGTAYDDVRLGLSGGGWPLDSNMNLGSVRLRSLSFDHAAGVNLTGGALRFAGGGTIASRYATSTISNAVFLNDNGAVNGTLNVSVVNQLRASGVWSGAGSLVKAGSGFLTLSGANDYAGATRVDQGMLFLGAAGALPARTALTVASGASLYLKDDQGVDYFSQSVGSLAGAGFVNLGSATLAIGGDGKDTAFSGSIGGSGGRLVKQGAGTLTLASVTGYGRTEVQAGRLVATKPAGDFQNDAVLEFANAESWGLSGAISGSGSLVKSGAGDFYLAGANTYTGGTTVRGGTVLVAGNGAVVGDWTLAGGSLDLNGRSPTIHDLNLGDGNTAGNVGTVSGAGVLTLTGALAFRGKGQPDGSPGETLPALLGTKLSLSAGQHAFRGDVYSNFDYYYDTLLSGTISGAGGLDKEGAFFLALTGQSTYAGATNVNGGALILGTDDALPTNTALTVASGARFFLEPYWESGGANGSHRQAVAWLGGAGRVDIGAGFLTVGNGDADGAFSGDLAGSGDFSKMGYGRQDISGANLTQFTGRVFLDEGTLATSLALANDESRLKLYGGDLEIVTDSAGTLTRALPEGIGLIKSGTGSLRVGGQSISGITEVRRGGLTVQAGSTYVSEGGVLVMPGASVRLGSFDTVVSGAAFENAGTLQGTGEIDAPFFNDETGRVSLGASDALVVGRVGEEGSNRGLIAVGGGTLTTRGGLTNRGQVSGRGLWDFDAGLVNRGALAASGGATDVLGKVENTRGGRVQSVGRGVLTFHDDVVHNGAEVFTGAGASTVFLGSVSGAGSYTGTGAVEFDGDLRPGNSPAAVSFAGDLVLGSGATTTMELGGTALGTGYDHLSVAGTAFLGGTLNVALYNGFQVQAGQSFDLFDGRLVGRFDAISLPAFSLGWDTSTLYTMGTIRAVPEPTSLAALGLGGLVVLRRRRLK